MNRNRKNERGVTIMVVAFTLVAILSMAALSIDVAELYIARGEAQRAANAAALAGAKMFVTSGFTSVQGSGALVADPTNICQSGGSGLPAGANVQAEAVATQNTIAGQPTVVTAINCDFTNIENPKISVSVTRTGVPTFFARLWGNTSTTTNATAVAEAYNPSGNTTPITASIKPWLVPNCDPSGVNPCPGAFFVDPTTGNILNNGSFIGSTIRLNMISTGAGSGSGNTLNSYSLRVAVTSAPLCPSSGSAGCSQVGSSSYLDNVACTSQVKVSCGERIGTGGGATISVQTGGTVASRTISGGECLIHASGTGLGQGQDSLTLPSGPPGPAIIHGGDNNPNPALQGIDNISRSDSVVTVPLYDGSALCTGSCTNKPVIGFLQLAITQMDPTGTGTPQVEAVILNASGCSTSMSGQAVSGDAISPVPVRLVHN